MVPAIIQFAIDARRDFGIVPGHVLEVGSYNVNGSIRAAFQPGAASYIGIDVSPGAGVDRVLSAHDIDRVWAPETFDTVLCCEMLEHDPRPWISVAQMHAVLKPGGTLFVSAPTFGFPLHRFPKDYYRFGEDAFGEFIFAGLDVLPPRRGLGPCGESGPVRRGPEVSAGAVIQSSGRGHGNG